MKFAMDMSLQSKTEDGAVCTLSLSFDREPNSAVRQALDGYRVLHLVEERLQSAQNN